MPNNFYGQLSASGMPAVLEKTTYTKIVSNNQTVAGTVEQVWLCDKADEATNTPAPNSSYPFNGAYLLINSKVEDVHPNLARITLTYTATYDGLPDSTVVEQSSVEEVPIAQHPNYGTWISNGWIDTTNNCLNASAPFAIGADKFVVGTTTVIVTDYYDSEPSSGHANIGVCSLPSGSYGDETNWLIVGSVRQQQNQFWTQITTYKYSAIPFWTTGDSPMYNTL